VRPSFVVKVVFDAASATWRVVREGGASQLTWSLTPHSPAGDVPAFRAASAPLHPLPRVGKTDGQDLLLSRTMLRDEVTVDLASLRITPPPYVGRFACDWHRLATTDLGGNP
jgi:hypothetical protein